MRMSTNIRERLIFSIAGLMLVVFCGSAFAAGVSKEMRAAFTRPAKAPEPADNKSTPARVALGKALFFDPRLSGSNFISCGTCHNPALGWSDGQKTAIGHGMQVLGRATPTVLNTAYQRFQFWDGRARTLEEQAVGPIQAAGEMNQNMDELVAELKAIPGYVSMFDKAYGKEGISEKTIGKAIAAFERTVVSSEAPFDRWLKGDKKAMNQSAQRGFDLFRGKANCVSCHQGFNFTDDGFHNLGLKGSEDEGRFAIKAIKSMKGAFKTPTLRDVALTAPYMHNGTYATLEEVVEHYNRGGDVTENLDPNMRKLGLTKQEVKDVVEFMRALTGKPVSITVPHLPTVN